MGLGRNGKLVFYTVSDLTRKDIADIGLKMLQLMPSDNARSNRPTIDMDMNNIYYLRGRNKVNPMESVAKFAMEWAQRGIIMTPVCDGDTRPTSKQQSNANRATREKSRNKAITQRLDLRQINQELKQTEITQETRDKLVKTRATLEKSIKTAETQSSFAVPANFPRAMEDAITAMKLHEQNVAGGKVDKVLTAEFQADSLLVGRYLRGKCQMIMSTDGDYPIFCGDDCILINEFTGGKAKICSTSRKTIEKALSYLDAKSKDKAKIVVPQYPIFEGVEDAKLRILMAVLIGCDVSPGGVHGAGPAWVNHILKEIMDNESNKSVYDQMIDHAVEKSKPKQKKTKANKKSEPKPKYSCEVLNTLVDAVLYEPTNEKDENATPLSHRTYMYDEPQRLASYLGEFRSSNTAIVDGPKVICCKGPCSNGIASHKFLAAEDHHKCKGCNAIVCGHCLQKINEDPYCLPCHLVEKLLPGTDPNDMMTVSQMREELKYQYKFGADADKLSIEEVEDAWDAHELQRAMEEVAKTVRMPLCPTSAISSGSHWKKLTEIDFRFGGSFLLDENIDEKYLPAVLELFASFVTFSPKEAKHTKWEKDSSVYDGMPTMFINIAKECRCNTGYRLLKRCIRHAMDTRTESLDNKKAELILYGDKVGIQLSTPIPASMKKEIYDGDTVLTKDELLCASCSCTSGSEKEEKVACVHTLPRGFLLSLLLAEDLAEHMLLELSSILTMALIEEDTWNESDIESMKKSALILMEASGKSSLAEKTKDSATLFDMLQAFRTGTQKSNEWKRVHKPPTEDEIGPMWKVLFDSPEHKAKQILKGASKKPNLDPVEEVCKFDPNYIQAGIVLNAAGIKPSQFDFPGFRLFEERRKRQTVDHDSYSEKLTLASREWSALVSEAKQRSRRSTKTQLANLAIGQKRKSPSAPIEVQELMHTPRKSARLVVAAAVTPSPKKHKSGPSGNSAAKKCSKVGCKVNSDNMPDETTFHRIPPCPITPGADASVEQLLSYRGKLELRREVMDRAGHGRDNDTKQELRICSCHPVEIKRAKLSIKYKGETVNQTYDLTLMSGAGSKSSINPSITTKGVGKVRLANNILDNLHRKMNELSTPAQSQVEEDEVETERRKRKVAEAKAAETMLLVQQIAERHSTDDAETPMNPSIAANAGIVESKKAPKAPPHSKRLFKVVRVGKPSYPNRKTESSPKKKSTPRNNASRQLPKVLLSISDKEVKRKTGFPSRSSLLAYIIVVCNGDFARIRQRRSPLTWFEEWFRYFEWKWHQTCRRQEDCVEEWGIDHHHVNKVKDCKCALEMAAMQSWPWFASFNEDYALRDKEKWSNYEKARPIFWDMTNVSAVRFNDASLQRSTYSEYYGENCWKGGVSVQLCGWVTNEDLWGGGVSDSNYNNESGYLQAQEEFQKTDLVNGKVVKFLNVLDRGYRAKYAAWRTGEQLAIQPPSARSDKRFPGHQTIYAGTVAHDRSGNERAVNLCKRSGLMKRGFKQGMSARRFNNAWRTWGFQANFMFKAVL